MVFWGRGADKCENAQKTSLGLALQTGKDPALFQEYWTDRSNSSSCMQVFTSAQCAARRAPCIQPWYRPAPKLPKKVDHFHFWGSPPREDARSASEAVSSADGDHKKFAKTTFWCECFTTKKRDKKGKSFTHANDVKGFERISLLKLTPRGRFRNKKM